MERESALTKYPKVQLKVDNFYNNSYSVSFNYHKIAVLTIVFNKTGEWVQAYTTSGRITHVVHTDELLEARKAIVAMLEENLFHIKNSVKFTEEALNE